MMPGVHVFLLHLPCKRRQCWDSWEFVFRYKRALWRRPKWVADDILANTNQLLPYHECILLEL